MKTLAFAILCSLSLSAFAEGTFDCHVKTGRHGAHEAEVAGTLLVTKSHIVFSSKTQELVFETSTREERSWRGGSSRWNEFSFEASGIKTTLRTDTEESMERITIESDKGTILVDVNTYLCFQTH